MDGMRSRLRHSQPHLHLSRKMDLVDHEIRRNYVSFVPFYDKFGLLGCYVGFISIMDFFLFVRLIAIVMCIRIYIYVFICVFELLLNSFSVIHYLLLLYPSR